MSWCFLGSNVGSLLAITGGGRLKFALPQMCPPNIQKMKHQIASNGSGFSGDRPKTSASLSSEEKGKKTKKKTRRCFRTSKGKQQSEMTASSAVMAASRCYTTTSPAPRGPSGSGNILGIIVRCVGKPPISFCHFCPNLFAKNTKTGQPSAPPRMGGHTAGSMT
uniref:Uncharacterized protein n=1 Tax=Sus scrofa TaxID=9823 RepID=A0A8D1FK17_PIG